MARRGPADARASRRAYFRVARGVPSAGVEYAEHRGAPRRGSGPPDAPSGCIAPVYLGIRGWRQAWRVESGFGHLASAHHCLHPASAPGHHIPPLPPPARPQPPNPASAPVRTTTGHQRQARHDARPGRRSRGAGFRSRGTGFQPVVARAPLPANRRSLYSPCLCGATSGSSLPFSVPPWCPFRCRRPGGRAHSPPERNG